MALQVWLPLTGDLTQQGLSGVEAVNNGATVNNDGKLGKCYEFGSGKYIKIIDYANEFLTYETFSLSVWFKCTAQNTGHTGSALISGGNWNAAANLLNLALGNFSSDHYTKILISGSGNWNNGYNYNFYLNTWYHIVLTSGNGAMRVYVNGELIDDSYDAFTPTTLEQSWICIGNGTYTQAFPFYGLMNDVRIYDHCLSVKEVKELSKGLVLHYKLDDPYIEPTTNLNPTIRPATAANATWGGHVTQWTNYDATHDPVPFSEGTKCEIVYGENGSTGGGASRSIATITAEPSTTYTYSCYIKPEDDFAYVTQNLIYKYEYKDGTKLTEAGLFSKSRIESVGDGWYRCWGTFTSRDTTTAINISFYTYPYKTITYWIGGWQIEKNDHMTPFVQPGATRADIMFDDSGYKNNGTPTSNLILSTDTPKYSASTYFPSGTTFIAAGRSAMVRDAITVNLWIKFSTWGNPISCTEGGGWNFENASGIQFSLYIASVGYKPVNSGVATNTLKDNWHMLTGTCDRESVKIYIDGELKGTTSTGSTNLIGYNGANGIFIGAEAAGTTTNPASTTFIGNISDVRIYATALSEEDILELYHTAASVDNHGNIYTGELKEV